MVAGHSLSQGKGNGRIEVRHADQDGRRHMTEHDSAKAQVIRAYDSRVIRTYCTLRFRIMNMRILEEIGQYLPPDGRILDVGCGFGFFTLYYALLSPDRRFVSIDINRRRIDMARSASEVLHLTPRVSFENRSAETLTPHSVSCDAAYMLDLIHHLPRECHRPLLEVIFRHLAPGGILILKDIATSPRWKVAFTWSLDVLMSPRQPPFYIDMVSMRDLLDGVGFDVKTHALLDILPYPHVLYICRKGTGTR